MGDRTTAEARLAALAAYLTAHGLDVDPGGRGLLVREQGTGVVVGLVTCRRRTDDAGALWFFTGAGEPIAPAGRIADAVVAVKGRLAAGTAEVR